MGSEGHRTRLGVLCRALSPSSAAAAAASSFPADAFVPKQLNLQPRSGDDPPQGQAFRGTATGLRGMVACAHPLAAQAGLRTLAAGGNAIDAAIAVAAALNVVEPFMSGLGGGGWMQVYHAPSGEHRVLDYCGQCPAGADLGCGRLDDTTKGLGILAAVIPGSPAGWHAMLERYGSGRLSTALIFQPAIELAERGFTLTKFGSRHFPGPGPYSQAEKFGDVLYQPELAQTYRDLAEGGVERFYSGDIAAKIVAFMEAGGGLISAEDLAGYRPRWLEPVTTTYRGYTVAACPPPNHGTQILEALNILEGWNLKELGHNSATHLHLFLEVRASDSHDAWVWMEIIRSQKRMGSSVDLSQSSRHENNSAVFVLTCRP
jgi:gamma-glutamyltranspeptidase/glutathione hydrolase